MSKVEVTRDWYDEFHNNFMDVIHIAGIYKTLQDLEVEGAAMERLLVAVDQDLEVKAIKLNEMFNIIDDSH